MPDFRDLTLYVVRHGQTEDNVAGRWTGCNDSPLTERGRRHARATGRTLKRVVADLSALAFHASPLHRASTTMRLLRQGAGLPETGFHADRRLKENDCGDFSSLTEAEINALDPSHLKGRDADEWNWRAPGGESQAEQFARVGAFLAALVQDSVIVCHGLTIRLVRGHLLGLSPGEIVGHPFHDYGLLRYRAGMETHIGIDDDDV
jgi:probable phosphoglycerate mutase